MSPNDRNLIPAEWPLATIEDIADVNPRLKKDGIPEDLTVSFVPMPAVGAGTGLIDVGTERPFSEVKKASHHFKKGMFYLPRLRPAWKTERWLLYARTFRKRLWLWFN